MSQGDCLRIIGGTLRGKKLRPLRGMNIRPTTDFVRESIFNILADRVQGAVVLDLFAGTGTLGIEALSRGAASATFVDNRRQAIGNILENVAACHLAEQTQILKRDISRGLGFLKATGRTFDLVFMDPPYEKGFVVKTLESLGRCHCVGSNACVVAEHSLREELPGKAGGFQQTRKRKYGNTLVSFYESVL
jgi:16S rRNA (guanine(966)-N(2))-methyltransferase RsmD